MTFSIKTDEFLDISSSDQFYSTKNRQLASKQTSKKFAYLITRSQLSTWVMARVRVEVRKEVGVQRRTRS